MRLIKRFGYNLKKYWQLNLMILLPLAFVLFFCYAPMYGIQIAFKDFSAGKGIWGSPWVGFKNFENFITGYKFWPVLWNTLRVSLSTLLFGFPFSVLLAVGINELGGRRYKKAVQMITYAPYFISVVILIGLLNQICDMRTGPLNGLITSLGFPAVDFIGSPQWFTPMYVFTSIWQSSGFNAVIYIAALSSVDQELYEAAAIDGVTKLKKIWYIDLPCIAPTVAIMFIMQVGRLLSVGFEKVFLMQNPINIGSSEVISTYIYNIGLVNANYSFGAAVDLFNSVISVVLVLMANRVVKRLSGTGLW